MSEINNISKLTCIIIEDEPLAMLRIKQYVEQIPFLQLLQTFSDPLASLPVLAASKVDLLFLDIQMEKLTGTQLLESLPHPPAVILTTAFEEYALKAFELEVVDYLLKPFSFERFLSAVMKVQQRLNDKKPSSFLFFKTANRQQKIMLSDIDYIEGARDYRKIHYADQTLLTLETFGELEERMPSSRFCRVHKSFMISLAKVEALETERVLIGKNWIPVSDTYRNKLIAACSQ